MKVLHYALVLAVVLGTNMAIAQEGEKPKSETLPWWKLAADEKAKDQTGPKAMAGSNWAPVDDAKPTVRKKGDASKPGVKEGDAGQPQKRVHYSRSSKSDGPKPQPRERLVYRLSNMPASEVASTVNELLRNERNSGPSNDTIVMADRISNSLIISGTSEAIHETVKFVEQLDAEPPMVCVQAVIALIESREGLSLLAPNPEGPELSCSHQEACELIEEFSKSGAVKILARPQVMTLDNQPAFIQIGDRVPRVTGVKDGQVTTELENVGLIVGVTPRISPDHVVTMEIDMEKSLLGPEDEGIPIGVNRQGEVVRCPKVEVMMVQTTVKIPPSRAVIIGGLALQDGDKRGELVLVVTPHVVAQKK